MARVLLSLAELVQIRTELAALRASYSVPTGSDYPRELLRPLGPCSLPREMCGYIGSLSSTVPPKSREWPGSCCRLLQRIGSVCADSSIRSA